MAHDFGKKESHPSYGTIKFTRVHGTSQALFNSSVSHQYSIMVEINAASRYRSLSTDHIMDEGQILTAYMTNAQFADAITGINQGSGTPITIKFVKGDTETRPEPPVENKREEFVRDHKESWEETIAQLEELINHPRLPVAARRKAEQIKNGMINSMPFLAEQFERQMERTITEAKAEIEAFALHREQSMGRAAFLDPGDTTPQIQSPPAE